MKDKRLLENLSAYLDGEADDPEQVERLLREDQDAACYYLELTRISQSLRALEPPAADPHFAARVVGRLRAGEGRSAGDGKFWWGMCAAAVTACLLLAVAWLAMPRLPGAAPQAVAQDEDVLLELVELRLAREPEAQDMLEAYASEDTLVMTADIGGDSWLDVLASQSWFDALAESFEEGQDFDVLLDSLSEEETSALKEALIDCARDTYAQGGWPT